MVRSPLIIVVAGVLVLAGFVLGYNKDRSADIRLPEACLESTRK